MTQLEDFLPARLIPWVVQRHERIEWLEERLKRAQERTPKNQPFGTHTDGELGPLTPGHTMFIFNGKIMDKPPSSENLPPPEFAIWAEVGIYPCVLENYLPFLLRLGVQMMQQSHSQANIPKQ